MKLEKKPRWLLCKPEHYSVVYQINPWMDVSKTPSASLAATQYQALVDTFTRLGCELLFVPPQSGLPDMVFTANAGLVMGDTCVLARFKFRERQGEERYFQEWFEQNGFKVAKLSKGFHEGEGDALFVRPGIMFGGYGFRSDQAAQEETAELLGCSKLVSCKLIDGRFYHLDTCFTPIDGKRALFVPSAFSKDSIREMEKDVELFSVIESDALNFACNAVVLEKDIILPTGCATTEKLLKSWGYSTHSLPMTEYLKAGGATKCLSLQLDRNNANG